MTVSVSWYDPNQTIIYYVFSDIFSIDELREAELLEREMTQDIDYAFHAIYDFSKATSINSVPARLFDYLKEDRRRSDYLHTVVAIVPKWAELLAKSIVQVAKVIRSRHAKKVVVVNNLAEALTSL